MKIRFCPHALFLSLFVFNLSFAQQDLIRIQAWKTPEKIRSLFLTVTAMTADVDTTLPAPRLKPEPEYTYGEKNTLFWDGDSTQTMLSSVYPGMVIWAFEIQARYRKADRDTVLWGPVAVGDDSATFTDLPAGITIEYRLRYYAKNSQGHFGRSVWSDPEKSIQDVSAPTLVALHIQELKTSGSKRWVDKETIWLDITAFDPDSGKVEKMVLHEKSTTLDHVFFHDIEKPSASIDTTIPYTMHVREHEYVTLSVRAVDVAGRESNEISIDFFWWKIEKMVCFPNPFNPASGEISTITVEEENITTARIFDPFGHLVRVLHKDASADFFEWDGKNGRGDLVSNGGYFFVVDGQPQLYCKIAVLR